MPTTLTVPNAEISEKRVRELLCSALEGGSNHWYEIESYVFPEGVSREDFREKGRFTLDEYWHPDELIPFHEGASTVIRDIETDERLGVLNRDRIQRGLELMAEKYPQHWADFVNENDDATTGDVFLQLAVLGEVIYG